MINTYQDYKQKFEDVLEVNYELNGEGISWPEYCYQCWQQWKASEEGNI